jgi:hypothetical protein
MSRLVDCRRCGRNREHHARGCCRPCIVTLSRQGRLNEYPRHNHHVADVVEDCQILKLRGWDMAQMASALGYPNANALYATLWYAKKKGLL